MVAKVVLVSLLAALLLLAMFGLLNGLLASVLALGASAVVYETFRRAQVGRQFDDIDSQSDEDFLRYVTALSPDAQGTDIVAARCLLAQRVGVEPEKMRSELPIAELDQRARSWPKSLDVADPVADFIEDWTSSRNSEPPADGFQDVGQLVAAVVSAPSAARHDVV